MITCTMIRERDAMAKKVSNDEHMKDMNQSDNTAYDKGKAPESLEENNPRMQWYNHLSTTPVT